jgi:simple sugar transport system permease protein
MTRLRNQWLNFALALAIVVIGVGVLGLGLIYLEVHVTPGQTIHGFYEGAFGSIYNTGLTLTNAVPLVLVALGWIISLSAGRIQIGFPGQIMIGGLCAASVVLNLGGLPAHLGLLLGLIAGVIGGALYAAIAALLWATRGVQEIVSTLLLNLIAVQIVAWAVNGPLQESFGGQPQTNPLPGDSRWPNIQGFFAGSLSLDIVLVPASVLAVVLLLRRTAFGFRMRLVGANPHAARNAGYLPKRIGVNAMIIGGAFAGLAGASLLLSGQTPAMTSDFEGGVGFNGIAVALLAFNSPIGVVFAAILFAALTAGSDAVQVLLNIPSSIAEISQGLVILFVFVAATLISIRSRRSFTEISATSSVGTEYQTEPSVAGDF